MSKNKDHRDLMVYPTYQRFFVLYWEEEKQYLHESKGDLFFQFYPLKAKRFKTVEESEVYKKENNFLDLVVKEVLICIKDLEEAPDDLKPKLWEISAEIVKKQNEALLKNDDENEIDWTQLENDWFDFMEEKLFGNEN